MYIRRKVFSLAVDQETGEEKLFSTTDIQSQKEFSEKKAQKDKDTKAEKAAKATTIGGATVGLGASAAGLGAEIGRKKVSKKLAKAEVKKEAAEAIEKAAKDMGMEAPKTKEELIKMAKKVEKLKKADKVLEKVSKHAPKAALAGVGASVAAGTAYKLARKKKDQKEFSDGKPEQKEFNSKAQKLLRRASDYKKAMTGSGRLVSAGEASQINKGMNTFGNNGESFIKQGREMNKSLKTRKTDINAKINRKAGLTSAV